MATITFAEIRRILDARCEPDERGFYEIIFTDAAYDPGRIPDAQYQNQSMTVDCEYGTVTISFDECGWLRSIDVS